MGDVVDVNDKVFIFAGTNLMVEKLNADKKSWRVIGDMERVLPGRPHYQQFSTLGMNNKLFTFGGLANLIGDWNQSDRVYVMDVTTSVWSEHSQSLLKARAWHRSVVGGATILFTGGDTTKPLEPSNFPGPRVLEPFEKWTWNGVDFTRELTNEFNFTNYLGNDYWEAFVVNPSHFTDDCFGPL